jgi:hypothetical protein
MEWSLGDDDQHHGSHKYCAGPLLWGLKEAILEMDAFE